MQEHSQQSLQEALSFDGSTSELSDAQRLGKTWLSNACDAHCHFSKNFTAFAASVEV